ncbi:MAG: excinuclease ABC subunit UvrA [Phycisphaerae bacterium]
MADRPVIRVLGARQHNLKNIDVVIPRGALVVITGVSGSGKSSLAFDTIYAEGQRRYVESLSAHARQYLEQMPKPDADRIEGLSPTIAIEQRVAAATPRSTVATSTEVYDFLRVLFARVGAPRCWRCDRAITMQTTAQVVDAVLAGPRGQRIMVLAPLVEARRGRHNAILERIVREGFIRARIDGVPVMVEDAEPLAPNRKHTIEVIVDRLTIKPEVAQRLADSVEIATRLSGGRVIVTAETSPDVWSDEAYSAALACPVHADVRLDTLSPRLFSFNSPHGACGTCGGLGITMEFDPGLVVPDPDKSLADGAIAPWRQQGRRLTALYTKMISAFCGQFGVLPDVPFRNVPARLRRIVLHGTTDADAAAFGATFEGVIPNIQRRFETTDSASVKQRLHGFLGESACETCGGTRLRREALCVKIAERSIADVVRMTIADARRLFDELRFTGEAHAVADPLLAEIRHRLRFMCDVGVEYLSLDRASATLSGGEWQRMRLATQIGGGLVGVCYVLDEPTVGLHPRDSKRLADTLTRLVAMDNTVIVVEHDEAIIAAADHVIDIGPGAGPSGGKIVAQGALRDVLRSSDSVTAAYLTGRSAVKVPTERRLRRAAGDPMPRHGTGVPTAAGRAADAGVRGGSGTASRAATDAASRGTRAIAASGPSENAVVVVGATANNLKQITVRFPLGCFICVTGVSGSGKSTLVTQILLRAIRRLLHGGGPRPGAYERISGAALVNKVVEIDQSPIGRTPRSNPATYVGVFEHVRQLFARTRESKVRGYTANRFSFNVKGGRCEPCTGQGTRRIAMHFLPDVFVRCDACGGTRYTRETLEVRFRGKHIADVLDMSVNEAVKFFDAFNTIRHKLDALKAVGLGYVKLGQPSNTLSGGEAQRIRLAAELSKTAEDHTMYILDEPTTGLHFADVHHLLTVLNRLADRGHTIIVIEHNLDVIKVADWVIDLGPDGGEGGGHVVAVGTPEDVAACTDSVTGRFLQQRLQGSPPLAIEV